MQTASYLFDLDPFTPKPDRPRPRRLEPGVRQALARLRRTMEAVPSEEWEERRRRWEALNRTVQP